jgi:MFS family permease
MITALRSTKVLTSSAYMSMFFLGVSGALIGAAARNIGLSPFEIGLMIAIQNVGFMLSVSITGTLADTHEKPKIMLVGSLILAFSLLTFYMTEIFWVNLVIMLLIGVGIGAYEGVTDAMLVDLHARRVSLHINVNHFFVTLGAIVIAVYLTYLQMNWRVSVVQSGIIVLLLAVFFGLTRLKVKQKTSEPYFDRLKILTRERIVIVFFLLTALLVGVEAGTIGILTTFLMDLRAFTQVTSKIGLTVFLVGIASGRLFVGFFSRREQIMNYLFTLFFLSFVFFVILYFIDLGSWNYVFVYLAGAAISALLPLVLTLGGLLYPNIAGTVLGIIKIAIPIGGILTPFVMSFIARSASLQTSLWVFPLSFLGGLLLLFWVAQPIKSGLRDQDSTPPA